MSNRAWVTLATNDSYGLGALVLANSLRRAGSVYPAVVLITPSVTDTMRDRLGAVFAEVVTVDVLDSRDATHLALLQRPELGITFTKIHCWNLTQFEKCVFLDADTLVVQNCDELFDREELSAAPDVGWPDCFNSGVFVFSPSSETFNQLVTFAQDRGSFDGGDQGLLNSFFSDWAHGDINKHLPFLYNVTSAAFYSYLPALKHYGQNLKIIHFIGAAKPWLQQFNWEARSVDAPEHLREFLQLWWDLFVAQVHPQLDVSMSGVAGNLARVVPGAVGSQREALDELTRRQGWEAGNIDYMGADSFANIWAKISQTLSQPRTSPPKEIPPKEPSPPKPVPQAPQESTPSPIEVATDAVLGEAPVSQEAVIAGVTEPVQVPVAASEPVVVEESVATAITPTETASEPGVVIPPVTQDTSLAELTDAVQVPLAASEAADKVESVAGAITPSEIASEPGVEIPSMPDDKAGLGTMHIPDYAPFIIEATPVMETQELVFPTVPEVVGDAKTEITATSDIPKTIEGVDPVSGTPQVMETAVLEVDLVTKPVAEAKPETTATPDMPKTIEDLATGAPVPVVDDIPTPVAAALSESAPVTAPEVVKDEPKATTKTPAPVAEITPNEPQKAMTQKPTAAKDVKVETVTPSSPAPPAIAAESTGATAKQETTPEKAAAAAVASDSPPLANTPSKEEAPKIPAAKSTEEAAQETRL